MIPILLFQMFEKYMAIHKCRNLAFIKDILINNLKLQKI